MLKRANSRMEDEDYDVNDFDDDDEVVERPAKKMKGKKQKPAKQKKAPKERKPSGFFADEVYAAEQGKVNSIMYFVTSVACIPLFIPMILLGGGYARKAKAYMEETGDTEGIGFLAAGKAIRSVMVTMFIIALIITFMFIIALIMGVAAYPYM